MSASKTVILLLYTIVIIDPYANIKYGEIDVYTYPKYNFQIAQEEKASKKRRFKSKYRRKKKRVWCGVCSPARWLYL